MVRLLIILCVACGALGTDAFGHDLKILASRLRLDGPGKSTIYLSWGHLLPVDDLIDAKTIERYELLTPKAKMPLKAVDVSLHANVVTLEESGLHQAVVSRKATLLTWIIDADGNRVMVRGSKDTVKDKKIDVSLRSQMFSKAVISVKGEETAVTLVGLPLEIVPLDPPAKWKAGGKLRIRLLHEGKPSAGVDIHATYVGERSLGEHAAAKTNADGVAEVHTNTAAVWVLKAVHRIPSSGAARERYDYDAFTTTLVLEVTP